MLSSSPPKIHNPRVTGVSPRPTDRRKHQKLRNTRGFVRIRRSWLVSLPLVSELRLSGSGYVVRIGPTARSRSSFVTARCA